MLSDFKARLNSETSLTIHALSLQVIVSLVLGEEILEVCLRIINTLDLILIVNEISGRKNY